MFRYFPLFVVTSNSGGGSAALGNVREASLNALVSWLEDASTVFSCRYERHPNVSPLLSEQTGGYY